MASFRRQQEKKTYYVEVGERALILDAYIAPNTHAKKGQTSEENIDKNTRKRSYEWFKVCQLYELLRSMATIVVTRFNSGHDSGKPVARVTYQYLACFKNVTTQNLKIQYRFQRRFLAGQYALWKDKIPHLNTKIENKLDNYNSRSIFHEKLVVIVEQNVIEQERQPINLQIQESAIDKAKTNETSSNYFAEATDCSTSAMKRKKTSLKKMAKKSKIALLESQFINESSESSIQEQSNGNCKDCLNIETSTIVNSIQINSAQQIQKTFINLEEIPKGLKDVREVKDLHSEHLKFLIKSMEVYLRTIFRGEVYSRRHEDYKKGGKSRDNLNFQVGMAHFTEDQHDCIMEALMKMFCSRHIKYIDYVTKVMLPEALMKLYKDIHLTTIEQAEDRLLNDTCEDT